MTSLLPFIAQEKARGGRPRRERQLTVAQKVEIGGLPGSFRALLKLYKKRAGELPPAPKEVSKWQSR